MAVSELEDGAMAAIRFKSGPIAQTHGAFTLKHAGTGSEVHGAEGSLIASDVMTQKPAGTVTLRTDDGEESLSLDHENLYARTAENFHAAIRGEGAPSAGGEGGLVVGHRPRDPRIGEDRQGRQGGRGVVRVPQFLVVLVEDMHLMVFFLTLI